MVLVKKLILFIAFSVLIGNGFAQSLNGSACASNSTSQGVNYTVTENQTTLIVPVPGLENNISVQITNEILGGSFDSILSIMIHHKYPALFVLMLLEAASVPIPSEVVGPLTGYLSSICFFNFPLAFFALTAGGISGIGVDYYIGYYLGREFFYKHFSQVLRIKKKKMEEFEEWFKENGGFAVFVTRLLPVVRSFMSFPAGFTKMPKVKFFSYSLIGLSIWNLSLMIFGYYLIGTGQLTLIFVLFALIMIILHTAYKRIVKKRKERKSVEKS